MSKGTKAVLITVMAVMAGLMVGGGILSRRAHERTEYQECEINGHEYYRITDGFGVEIGVVHSPDCRCDSLHYGKEEQNNGTGLYQGSQEGRQNERDSVSRKTDIDTSNADSSVKESIQTQ